MSRHETLKRGIVKFYTRMLIKKWKLTGGANMLADFFIGDYKQHIYPYRKIFSIHKHGFSVPDWGITGLTKKNCSKYLSTADYFAMHPINGEFSKWIDDKLTLKYLCSGTSLDKYFPGYYFQIDTEGHVLPLSDYNTDEPVNGIDTIIDFLKKKGNLAAKPLSTSCGRGFYRFEYREGEYYLNGKAKTEKEIRKILHSFKGYIIIEFFKPHPDLARYNPDTANVLRYTSGRQRGETHGRMLASTIQFGTKKSGFTEYSGYGLLSCIVDKNGYYGEGNYMDFETNSCRVLKKHPDTGIKFEGRIPHWDKALEVIRLFEEHFPQLIYLAFDIIITDNDEIKIVEINSLPALTSLQRRGSVFEREAGDYYRRLLKRKVAPRGKKRVPQAKRRVPRVKRRMLHEKIRGARNRRRKSQKKRIRQQNRR